MGEHRELRTHLYKGTFIRRMGAHEMGGFIAWRTWGN